LSEEASCELGLSGAANFGAEGSIVVNRVREGKGRYGYNAATGEYGDLVK
jgi:chaperonin GroEL